MALLLQQLSYWVLQLGLIPLCFSKILAIECPDFQSMTSPVLQHKRSAPADSAGFQALTMAESAMAVNSVISNPNFDLPRLFYGILLSLTPDNGQESVRPCPLPSKYFF